MLGGPSITPPTTLTLPPAAQRGTRYVRIRVDGANNVIETSETNNNRWDAISITKFPDLSVSLSTVPYTGDTQGPGSQFTGRYTIANADYAATGVTNLVLTLAETGSADTDDTSNVTFTNSGDVTDAVTNADATNYGPTAATDGAGPAIISAATVTTTTRCSWPRGACRRSIAPVATPTRPGSSGRACTAGRSRTR